ncbi:MAG: SseB family protein [Pseudomonadota bacterium]
MSAPTPLDTAVAAMAAGGDDEARAFYTLLRSAELAVPLEGEAVRLVEAEDGPVALAFDTALRMTDLLGPGRYALFTGRRLAGILAGQGVALGLNFGAPSETLLPAAAVDWLADVAAPIDIDRLRPERLRPPEVAPDVLMALDRAMPALAAMLPAAILVGVEYQNGADRTLLALPGAPPGSAAAAAQAVSEALALAGLSNASLDVAATPAALTERLERVGLKIDLTPPARAAAAERPPRLR